MEIKTEMGIWISYWNGWRLLKMSGSTEKMPQYKGYPGHCAVCNAFQCRHMGADCRFCTLERGSSKTVYRN